MASLTSRSQGRTCFQPASFLVDSHKRVDNTHTTFSALHYILYRFEDATKRHGYQQRLTGCLLVGCLERLT